MEISEDEAKLFDEIDNEIIAAEVNRRMELERVERDVKLAKSKTTIVAEAMRDKIDAEMLVSGMLALVSEVDSVEIEDVPRVRLKLDVYSTLLKKVLPDLKAMEVKTGTGNVNKLLLMVGDLGNVVQNVDEVGRGEEKN